MEETNNPQAKKSVLPIILIALVAVLLLLSGFLGWHSMTLQKKLDACAGDTSGYSKLHTAQNDSLTHELASLAERYDSLSARYGGLDSLFKAEKDRIILLETQLRQAGNTGNSGNVTTGSGSIALREEIALLKGRQDDYIAQIDSLRENNRLLTLDNIKVKSDLEIEKDKSKGYDKTIADLNSTIEKGAVLTVAYIKADAIQVKGNSEVIAAKARKANKLRCCFTVAKNTLVKPGYKDFYVRVMDVMGQVIKNDDGSSGEVTTKNNGTLNYTTKASVLYENENVETCVYSFNSKKTYEKGVYKFEVYYMGERVGTTNLTLK